jgi:hypothetical protein
MLAARSPMRMEYLWLEAALALRAAQLLASMHSAIRSPAAPPEAELPAASPPQPRRSCAEEQEPWAQPAGD